jgi:hypothetical protein
MISICHFLRRYLSGSANTTDEIVGYYYQTDLVKNSAVFLSSLSTCVSAIFSVIIQRMEAFLLHENNVINVLDFSVVIKISEMYL